MHQAKLGFNHNIVSGAAGVRASLAIPCDTGVNQSRIDVAQSGVVHIVLGKAAWQIVLNQDVTFRSQLMQYLYTLRVLEREAE
jgi:hypothetical protein